MKINCHVDIKGLRKHLKRTGEDVVPGATVRALNRAVEATRTAIRRDLAGKLKIKQKKVKRRVRFGRYDKARKGKYEARVFLVVSDLPVSYLGTVRQTKPGAVVKGKIYPKAFKATMRSGHIGVFLPKNPGDMSWRRKIIEVKEPIGAELLGFGKNEMDTVGVQTFQKRFNVEFKRLMGVQ